MKRWLIRTLVVVAAVTVGLVTVTLVTVHAPSVQRHAFELAADRLEAATGWRIEADSVRLRFLPAVLRIEHLEISAGAGTVARVAVVEAHWRWRELQGSPPRLASLEIVEPVVDLRALPTAEPPAEGGDELDLDEALQALEIGRVRLTGGSARAVAADIVLDATGVRLDAGLQAGRLSLGAAIEQLEATRAGRSLAVGPAHLAVDGGANGLQIRSLEIAGDELTARAHGTAAVVPATSAELDVEIAADVLRVLTWWDPSVAAASELTGVLRLVGRVALDEQGPRATVAHDGPPLSVAGYRVDSLAAVYSGGAVEATIAGADWGSATVTLDTAQTLRATAALEAVDLDRLARKAALDLPVAIPAGAVARAAVEVTTPLPPTVDSVVGAATVDVVWPTGSIAVDASLDRGSVTVRQLEARLAGAELQLSGHLTADQVISAEAALEVPDPGRLEASLVELLGITAVGLGGGAARFDATVGGTLDAPAVHLDGGWDQPALGELCAHHLELTATASPTGFIGWDVLLEPLGGGSAQAWGTTARDDFATSAEWGVALPDLAAVAAGLATAVPTTDVRGALHATGRATWADGAWEVVAEGSGREIGSGAWQLDSVDFDVAADAALVTLRTLRAELAGGRITAAGVVGLGGVDDSVNASLEVAGVAAARLPLALPPELAGTIDVTATVAGTIGQPQLQLDAAWAGDDPIGLVQSAAVQVALEDGVARLSLPRLATAAGTLAGRGEAPLGGVPRPAWLWPQAPSGPIRLNLVGAGLESTPLLAALGQPEIPARVTTDLSLDISWDLGDAAARFAEVRFDGLEIANAVETLRADGPVVLQVDGTRAVLSSARLAGARSRIEATGSYSLASGEVEGHADAVLAPEMAQLLPVAVSVREPLQLNADLDGTLADATGRIEVHHPGGRFVMRDPALAIEDLELVLVIEDGALWIDEGSAIVNRGTVQLGGGWDPASGQGVVIEMKDVVALLPFDILTRWSGDLALEPDPERLVNVTGDLVLEGGVWDRPVDLAGFVFGPTALAPAADDPLWEVGLDLDVRGRGGLAVANNLGEFHVTWSQLEISGTAAQPIIVGHIAIAPGGTLNLAGRRVQVQRGSIDFTGDPVSDPTVEIVPMSDVAAFEAGAAGEGSGIDTSMMARRGVAQGLGSVLGLENETLRPAEIAIESDTTTTTNFTAGQRLSRNVALFLTTDLADVQDRTTTLQLWNFDPLPGLALQLWEQTIDESSGANLVERYSWGGSSGVDDRPTIQSIHLEGEWPVWKWRLKRSLGLHRGQPYEPFLGFAASLRLERELAARGWQQARVDLETEGPDRLPSLSFRVDPGPRSRVEFVGETPPSHIRREVTALYQPPPLERSAFQSMVDLLERHYRTEGYPNAAVAVARQDGAVVATIERGAPLAYEGPVVEGVAAPQAEAIRRVLGNPSEMVSLLEDPDRGARVVQRILHAQGYREASLQRVWAERVADDLSRVHIEVDPGPRATIRALTITGDDPLGLAHSQEALADGQPLDRQRIELAADRIRRQYRNSGYVDAEVMVHYVGSDPGPWDLELELAPGAARTVGEIHFSGRKSIGRRTLLAGVEIEPGEPLRRDELDQSVINLAGFAPIERVRARVTPSGPGTSDVEFDLVERDRWTVEAGAGWSSDRGAEARFGIRDGGLFGRGGSVYLRGRWQKDEQLALLNAELPPLPGSKLSYGTSLSFRRRDVPYDPEFLREEVLTASIELTREFGSGVSVHPYYRLSHTVTSVKDPDFPFPEFFEGTLDVATLGAQLRRDRLDNPFDPRRGTYLGLDVGWSSSLFGSDLETLRSLLTGTAALAPRGGWTWAQTFRLGTAKGLKGTELDPDAKFFAGGQASIRGFDRDLVGPVTVNFDGTVSPDGGGALVVLNEELRIPVWDGLRVAVFTDLGQVWESWSEADLELAVGAGIGLRYATPIGPLWADVAWPVANRGYSSKGPKFYFGIGRPF